MGITGPADTMETSPPENEGVIGRSEQALNRPIYRALAWFGLAVLGVAVVGNLMLDNWRQSLTISVFFVIAFAFILSRKRLPTIFSLLFVIAALMNAAGWAFNWFSRIPLYDPITHGYTTFALTLAIAFLTYTWVRVEARKRDLYFGIFVASIGLALGALWEIFEWSFGAKQTYRSVVIDLAADGVGAALAGWLGVTILKRVAGGDGANVRRIRTILPFGAR